MSTSTTLPTSTTTRRKRKKSRLLESITNGNVEKIIKLLSSCDPNFIDDNTGETPLTLAAITTALSTTTTQRVIVALVNGGALLDFRSKDGKTPLHSAVSKSNYAALKTFLDLGASPNYKDINGLTPLFYSIISKCNPKLTQLLLHEHSKHGVVDQHGWQEVHHACKLGLVAHLEQLLYYGCDMNCKIIGSGNTPLHVAAINDQIECARVLLLRGCNSSIVNNSHQNAYQVAVIANNMKLAELIANHKVENVVPYRDKPKYNPARRPPSTIPASSTLKNTSNQDSNKQKINDDSKYVNGGSVAGSSCCVPSSPCLSQRSCATSTTISTTTSSSGVCCELDGSQSEEGGDDEGDSDEDTPKINKPEKPRVEGRREQKLLGIGASTTLPARGRRRNPIMTSSVGSIAFDTPPIHQNMPPITSYNEKTVSLHKGNKGFGFVLRGAKATSPVQKAQEKILISQPISLQYLDDIEVGGIADAAGLKRGDFLLNVNGVDVTSSSHEHVVNLIRQSGDKVTMTVATPIYQIIEDEVECPKKSNNKSENVDNDNSKVDISDKTNDSDVNKENFEGKHKSSTLPREQQTEHQSRQRAVSKGRAPPPAPPKRDPSTTLSIGRARARSLCVSGENSSTCGDSCSDKYDLNNENQNNDNYDSEGRSTKSSSPTASIESMVVGNQQKQQQQQQQQQQTSDSQSRKTMDNENNKVASIKSRGSRRISAFELEEFFSRQSDEKGNQINNNINSKSTNSNSSKPTTLQALKKKKKKKLLGKTFHSTSDIQQELLNEKENENKSKLYDNQQQLEISKHEKQIKRLSSSQEDLSIYSQMKPQILMEMLTLKNGKIVKEEDNAVRVPPPSYPPPPPPTSMNEQKTTINLKVNKTNTKSDYANVIQLNKENEKDAEKRVQPFISFKPPQPLPDGSETSNETSVKRVDSINEQKDAKTQQQQQQKNQTTFGTLKKAKLPNKRSSAATPSVYTRQETLDLLDDEIHLNQQPFIPDPDYSSTDEDDPDTPTNTRDLSTFKTPPQTIPTKAQSTTITTTISSMQTQPNIKDANTPKMTQSYPGPLIIDKESLAEAKLKSVNVMSSSIDESLKSKSLSKANENNTIDEKSNEPMNKVKESIQIFERRSSLSSENSSLSSVQVSILTRNKNSNNENEKVNNQVNSKEAKNLRSSKSCFEVDICDNSSSGVSSDIDGEHLNHTGHMKVTENGAQSSINIIKSSIDEAVSISIVSNNNINNNNNKQMQIHTLNRRNSAIVSEKIANLMAQTQLNQSENKLQHQQSLPQTTSTKIYEDKKSDSESRRASIASTQDAKSTVTAIIRNNVTTGNSNIVSTNKSTSGSNSVSSTTLPTKAAPTMTKTWSEISSAIRAVKNEQANLANKTNSLTKASSHKYKGESTKIRVQVDSLGLAAVNEVDVLSELVPPPPEFAAPPPNPNQKPNQIQPQQTKTNLQNKSQTQQRQSPSMKKEEIRIITPNTSTVQHHVVHKPTPQQAAIQQQAIQRINEENQTARKNATPPPPPPPEFCDLQALAKLANLQHLAQQQQQAQANFPQYHHPYPQSTLEQFATLTKQNIKPMQKSQYTSGHFSTLSRLGGLEGLTAQQIYQSQQQQINNHQNYQQFATLTRTKPNSGCNTSPNSLYSDYTRLTVQNRLLRQQQQQQLQHQQQQQQQQQQSQPLSNAQHQSLHHHHQQATLTPQQQYLIQQQHVLQQKQYQQIQQQLKECLMSNAQSQSLTEQTSQQMQIQKQQVYGFQRKSMVDWIPNDVCDWLIAIGMAEYRSKFEFINGIKLLRLDNNDLMGIGIRISQHRCYILEKIKQHLHYQQQHPPSPAVIQ